MRRIAPCLLAAVAVLCAGSASAQTYRPYVPPNGIQFRAGLFMPQAQGEYFDSIFQDFTTDSDDFDDFTIGFDYVRTLVPHLELVVGGSYYESTDSSAYRDFEDSEGRSIFHDTHLELSNFDVGLRVKLAPAHFPVVPYVGGGGTLVWYHLDEVGDFIDFVPPPGEIFFGTFHAEGYGPGYFLMAGLDIPLGRDFGLVFEGRWRDVSDELSDDFSGFGDIDLGGTEVTGGVIWRF